MKRLFNALGWVTLASLALAVLRVAVAASVAGDSGATITG